jgi:glucose dehydrogenase
MTTATSFVRALLWLALCCAAGVRAQEGDWPMAARDHASTRFSPLADIRTDNGAAQAGLHLLHRRARGHEAAPLVVGDTMYVSAPYPNYLYALDLTKPGAPLKWKFEPKPDAGAQGVACCDVVNRGAAYAQRPRLHEHARRADDRGRRGQRHRRSGARSWATSPRARPSPWRRWW